jgi:hypothetical protein
METVTLTLGRLQRLASCKAQYVGIQRPGQYPFTLQRRILAQLIEGLPVDTRVELNGKLEISSDSARRRYALCEHVGQNAYRSDRIKACASFKLRMRRTATKPSNKVPAWLLKELRQAERQLTHSRKPKANPADLFAWLHPVKFRYQQPWELYGQTETEYRANERAEILAYYRAKPQRKQLARIAALWLQGRIKLQDVYKRVRQAAFTLKPLSQQPKAVRDRGAAEFVKHLAYRVGVPTNPLSAWQPSEWQLDAIRGHNEAWQHWREARERVQYLQRQIPAFEKGEDVSFDETLEC